MDVTPLTEVAVQGLAGLVGIVIFGLIAVIIAGIIGGVIFVMAGEVAKDDDYNDRGMS